MTSEVSPRRRLIYTIPGLPLASELVAKAGNEYQRTGGDNMLKASGDEPAKYACRNCGSNEVSTNTETYAVFRAEGDETGLLAR